MNWIKNSKVLVLADQVVFSGTSFLLTILIARHLHVSDFGIYSAYVLVIYLGISAISACTTQIFQVASDRSASYISFVYWLHIILLTLGGLLLIVADYLLHFNISKIVLVFGWGFVMYDFSRKILLGLDKTFATLMLDFFTSVLMVGSFFVFKYLGTKNLNIMLTYFSGVYFLSILYTVYMTRPFFLKMEKLETYLKRHILGGKWLFFTAVSQWWSGNLFVVASGIYLGTAALGALRLGQSLFGVLNVLLQTFENYILPQTALKMQQSQSIGIAYLKEMNQKLAYVFIPVLLLVFIFSSFLITLAGGKDFTEYAFVLKGLSILYIFILLSQPLRFYFRSMQMNSHFFYAYFNSLVFALSTSHWLISAYGLQGAIAGLIGSQILLLTYWSIILQLKNINLWKSSTSY